MPVLSESTPLLRGALRRRVSVVSAILMAVLTLVCSAILLLTHVSPASADEADGYLTISGVPGVSETETFETFSDLLATTAGSLQHQESSGYNIYVHGSVEVPSNLVEEDGNLYMPYLPVGATLGFIGADDRATLLVPANVTGGPGITFVQDASSIVVRNLTFSDAVGFSCQEDLVLDSNVFKGQLRCTASGQISIAANMFVATRPSAAAVAAAAVSMCDNQGSVSVVNNYVEGFGQAFTIAALDDPEHNPVVVTSNTVSLVPEGAKYLAGTAGLLELVGGPWRTHSVTVGSNVLLTASCYIVLNETFSAMAPADDGTQQPQYVWDGSLWAQTLLGVFEILDDQDVLPSQSTPIFALDPKFAGTGIYDQVHQAISAFQPSVSRMAPQSVAHTVFYDGNGATSGEVPPQQVVPSGSNVRIETAATLARSSYVFEGWNTAPDGTGTFYAVGQLFFPDSDIVLYAQWAPMGTVAAVDVTCTRPSE